MNFGDLKPHQLEVYSDIDFETICDWMENRFTGLPQFHTSIDLGVLHHQHIIVKERGSLQIPRKFENLMSPRLSKQLGVTIAEINKKDGEKGFGLLYLRIRLLPKFLKNLLKNQSLKHKYLIYLLGSTISVPVVLALLSRKTSNYYESIALGVKGVTYYNSLLEVHAPQENLAYQINGGLHVSVYPEDLDHSLLNKISQYVDLGDLINSYLTQYLVPEKEEIIGKLCAYTFNGCQMPKPDKNQIVLKPKIALSTN